MFSAFKSFFSRAAEEESKDSGAPEYDTFEQVTASKFDSRVQVFYFNKKLKQDMEKKLEHPNYLTDRLKTSIFKSILRHKQATNKFVDEHVWTVDSLQASPPKFNPYAATEALDF
mmetsp:Transcript_25194/g.33740  ORF Transcript_25194/g.33740 Transcript_25194/m.33740 type:complete len:115 (-) Transcript_25194:1836-2180(-)